MKIRAKLKKKIVQNRRGAFMVLAFLGLAATAGFLAMSMDLGVVSVTKTRMQNVADSAALAAAQEISIALDEISDQLSSGGDVQGEVQSANEYAMQQAKLMAKKVVELNGMYIDPSRDVEFGQRILNEETGAAEIIWGGEPFNVVKVTVRRDNPDLDAADGELELFFAKMFDTDSVAMKAEATAYIDARDLVVVMDFSGSMSYDSQFRSDTINKLGQTAIEDNLYDMWQDLGQPTYGNLGFDNDWVTIPSDTSSNPPVTVKWRNSQVDVATTGTLKKVVIYFKDGGSKTFKKQSGSSNTYKGTGSYTGDTIDYVKVTYRMNGSNITVSFDLFNYSTLKRGLGLTSVSYPYPSGSWDKFLSHCLYDSDINRAGFRYKFGMMNMVHYWLDDEERHYETPELYKTRHYPFHAVKEGGSLLCSYLDSLNFGDHLGLVTYDTYHRVETTLTPSAWVNASVDISSDPITDDYNAIDTIQRHKQAAHYYSTTNIGGGMSEAIGLMDDHSRYGAQKTILLMTDGNANVSPSGWSVPAGFNWNQLTDYNGDGVADYTTSNKNKLYAFAMVKEAVDKGYTVHTMSVGANADRELMKAIAFAGDGIWLDVPGGSTVAEMEAQMTEAFARIAANVPPPKLMNPVAAE